MEGHYIPKLHERVNFRFVATLRGYYLSVVNDTGKEIGFLDTTCRINVIRGSWNEVKIAWVSEARIEDARYRHKGVGFAMYSKMIEFLKNEGYDRFCSDANGSMSDDAERFWDTYLCKQYPVACPRAAGKTENRYTIDLRRIAA